MLVSKDNKIIGKVEDEDTKTVIMMFTKSQDDKENLFKQKFWKAFENGLILIGYNPEKKALVTTPDILKLIKDGSV